MLDVFLASPHQPPQELFSHKDSPCYTRYREGVYNTEGQGRKGAGNQNTWKAISLLPDYWRSLEGTALWARCKRKEGISVLDRLKGLTVGGLMLGGTDERTRNNGDLH